MKKYMSYFKLRWKTETIAVLNNCDIPKVPPEYRLFGTMNKLIAIEKISIPNVHFENLNQPHLNSL